VCVCVCEINSAMRSDNILTISRAR